MSHLDSEPENQKWVKNIFAKKTKGDVSYTLNRRPIFGILIDKTESFFLFFFDTSKIGRRLRVPKMGGFLRKKWSQKYFWKKQKVMFLIPSTADRFLRFGKKKNEIFFYKTSHFWYPQPPTDFWDLVKKKMKKISKLGFFFFQISKIGRRLRVPKVGGLVFF